MKKHEEIASFFSSFDEFILFHLSLEKKNKEIFKSFVLDSSLRIFCFSKPSACFHQVTLGRALVFHRSIRRAVLFIKKRDGVTVTVPCETSKFMNI